MNNKYVKIRSYLLNACRKYFINYLRGQLRPAEAADEVTLIINNLCKYSFTQSLRTPKNLLDVRPGRPAEGSFYAQDFAAAALVLAAARRTMLH